MQSQQEVGRIDYAKLAKQITITRILAFAAVLEIAGLINPLYDELKLGPMFYLDDVIVIAICSFALYFLISNRKRKELNKMTRKNRKLFIFLGLAMIVKGVAIFFEESFPREIGDNVSSLIFIGTALGVCYIVPRVKAGPSTSDSGAMNSFAKSWVLVFLCAYVVFSIIDTWYDVFSGEIIFGPVGIGSVLHEYGVVLVCGTAIAYFILRSNASEYRDAKKTSLFLMTFITVAFMTKIVGIYLDAASGIGGLQRDDIGVMAGLLAALVQSFA